MARPLRVLLRRALLLSSALALALMGGFFTLFSYDLEDTIFNRLVAAEAERQLEGRAAELPAGMSTHRGHAALPPALARKLSPSLSRGEYEVATDGAGHFHVAVRPDAHGGEPLYVAFQVDTFTSTTGQLGRNAWLLLVSAALALLTASGIAVVVARRVSRPLEQLAAALGEDAPGTAEDEGAVQELGALRAALRERDARIQRLLERERQFNRDVSHELRTPLAVAQGAVELIERAPPQDAAAFARLRSAVLQMGLLTEGILWLARTPRPGERCDLRAVSHEVVALYDGLRQPAVSVVVEAEGPVEAPVSAAVARVLLGNLVKNAFGYTRTGSVQVHVAPGLWRISDSGEGLGNVAPEHAGFGVGLSLVQRLAQRLGWSVTFTPLQPRGTRVELRWA
ncbi:HAMP domain-containing sensor histidine kinase [Corallococcus sp. CA053C]|uniref:sensor histidine kinase n=1 Tax=Corallococcus sp. CA053C TaxID=2316732 RepID=UPI001F4845D3|nr:HAMP domain-containing sensor histidine kinase [Corallococcus sp. CA053C]